MKTSEKIDLFSKAYVAAQADLKNATFDKINPHFKSKYATLAGMRDSLTPALAKHGLAVLQGTTEAGSGFIVTTRLIHESGQWIESAYPFAISKPQEMGSAYTYARRYSLAAICGIASEDDDDGNSAQGAETKPKEMPAANGTQGASKSALRPEYDAFVKDIRNATGIAKLETWKNENLGAIDKLPPDWIDELRVEFVDKKSELERKAAA